MGFVDKKFKNKMKFNQRERERERRTRRSRFDLLTSRLLMSSVAAPLAGKQVVVAIGAQWGDEGKGKIVDALSEAFDVCARYNGGSNAGHTLVVGGQK